MKRETDEEFIVRMRDKLSPLLVAQLERNLRAVRANCREHRWRAETVKVRS